MLYSPTMREECPRGRMPLRGIGAQVAGQDTAQDS